MIGLNPAEANASREPEVGNDLSALLLKQLGLESVADEEAQAEAAASAEPGSDPVE